MPSGPDVQHAGLLLRRLLWVEAGWNRQEPRPTPSGLPRARRRPELARSSVLLLGAVCVNACSSATHVVSSVRTKTGVNTVWCCPYVCRSRLPGPDLAPPYFVCVCIHVYVYFVKTSFKTLFLQSSFRFTTKPRGKNRASLIFPHPPPPPPRFPSSASLPRTVPLYQSRTHTDAPQSPKICISPLGLTVVYFKRLKTNES